MTRPSLSEHRALAVLAAPIAVTQLAQVALTTTDTIMIGILGAGALAGGGLAIVLFNQVRTMGVGLVTAAGNQVAAAVARGEQRGADHAEEIRDLVRSALLVATAAGLVGATLLMAIGQTLTGLGQDPQVAALARMMLVALAPGLLPCLWFQVLRQYTVGMRRPHALMWITVGSIAVNALLNAVLGFGLGPLPRLGLVGIGTATTLVYVLSFVVLYLAIRRDQVLAPMVSLSIWRARGSTTRRLLRLGVPIAATYGSEAGIFSVIALIMGTFGAAVLAAHTVVNQLVYVVFQVSIGISHGSSILVSREIASGRSEPARQLARIALLQGAAVAAFVAVFYLAVPGWVLGVFLDPGDPADAAAIGVATHLLMVAAVLQFADFAQNIGVGLLRGLDDTKAGFRATLLGYWVIGLPVALLLGRLVGLGPVGVWLGLLGGLAATAFLLLRRYARVLAATNW